MKKGLITPLILLSSLLFIACSSDEPNPSTNPSSSSSSSSASSSASGSSSSTSSSSSSSSSSSGDARVTILDGNIPLGLHFSNLRVQLGNFITPVAIEFKEEGFGELITNTAATTFTWIDAGDHLAIDVADIVIKNEVVLPEFLVTDSQSQENVVGDLVLESLEISLPLIETETPTLAWQPTVRFEPYNANYENLVDKSSVYDEPLIDAATTPSPSAFGSGTWYYDQGNNVVKLIIDTKGTASQISLSEDSAVQDWANWDIQPNYLKLTQVEGNINHSANLYVLDKLDAGYRWIRIDDAEGYKTLSAGLIIKGDDPATFTEEDWVGIWSYEDQVVMFTSDHFRRYAFAGWTNIWHYLADRQSLAWQAYEQGEFGWKDFCNPLSLYPCAANAKQELKLVSKSGNDYWMVRIDEFNPGWINQALVLAKKISPLNAFGDWIHNYATTNFYEAISSGYRVWSFSQNQLLISDAIQTYIDYQDPNVKPFEIVDGKILLNEGQTNQIIELIEHDEKGILVCKYAEGADCIPGTEFRLLNTSPAAMSVVSEGEGYVDYSMDYEHFGITRELTLTPKDGHEVDSVEGCGGALNGSIYITAPIREDCTVSVTFRKVD